MPARRLEGHGEAIDGQLLLMLRNPYGQAAGSVVAVVFVRRLDGHGGDDRLQVSDRDC